MQGECEAAQGLLDCVFVVGAYVGSAGGGEGDAVGVGEEGGEVMVVLGGGCWRRGEFEEATGEGSEGGCVMEDRALGELAVVWLFLSCWWEECMEYRAS